jgi:hypothetical protein
MNIKELVIASLAVAALFGCSKQSTPANPSAPPTKSTGQAQWQAELDAYISWAGEYQAFEKAHMKKVPELLAMTEAAQQRGEPGVPSEYQRYQQEAADKYRDIMSRRPLTRTQQDVIERTVAAMLRFRPNPEAETLVWEIHHNDQELDALRRLHGAQVIDDIIAQERRFLELKNE